jgi:spore coat protein I
MLRKHKNLLTTGPVSIHGKIQSVFLNELPAEAEIVPEEEKVDEEAVSNAEVPLKPVPDEAQGEAASAIPEDAETLPAIPQEEDKALHIVSPEKEMGMPEAKKQLAPEMREKLTLLARVIMKNWPLEAREIEVIQGGEMALVWKVMTDRGTKCLKRINRPEKKALFSVYAQHHMAEKGANVPAIIRTTEEQLYAKHGPFLFVLYDWIEGRKFDLTTKEDLRWIMKGMAQYHVNSEGFLPPEGIPFVSNLGQWPKHYMKRCQQMESWKLIAERQPEDIFSQRYLEIADEFIESGRDILNQLEKDTCYWDWVKEIRKTPILCHQDYGKGNTMLVDEDVWIIDLDTTAYDLPIRDVRKFTVEMMEDGGTWNDERFETMLSAYESVNPLTGDQKKVLYIDIMFHYGFYKVVRDKFSLQNERPIGELERLITFEREKKAALLQKIEQL